METKGRYAIMNQAGKYLSGLFTDEPGWTKNHQDGYKYNVY